MSAQFEQEKKQFKDMAEAYLAPFLKRSETKMQEAREAGLDDDQLDETIDGEESSILLPLMDLQSDILTNDQRTDAQICGLAEVTLRTLLEHLRIVDRSKTDLEDVFCANFLVDPGVVAQRRTSLHLPGRTRDHKLQVLYRMEIHWLMSNEFKQSDCVSEMLMHLRQISLWNEGEPVMQRFLQDTLTPVFIARQPEVLSLIYDEIKNVPRPQALADLFSPQKSYGCPR